MMRNHNVHIATHLIFMVTAVMAWWPVCCPLPAAGRLSEPAQMLYLFLLGVPMQIVAAVITLSDTVLYPWYASAPHVGTVAARRPAARWTAHVGAGRARAVDRDHRRVAGVGAAQRASRRGRRPGERSRSRR